MITIFKDWMGQQGLAKDGKYAQFNYENLVASLTPDQYRDLTAVLENLPPVQVGECNIVPFRVGRSREGGLLFTVIIRNGRTNPVKFQELPLTVKTRYGGTVAEGVFAPQDLIIMPNRVVIWTFAFSREELQEEPVDLSALTLEITQDLAVRTEENFM